MNDSDKTEIKIQSSVSVKERIKGKSFSEQVDDVLAGNFSQTFDLYIGETPSILINEVGLPSNPILMRSSKVKKILLGHQDMNIDIIKLIPQAIESPMMVISSKTHPNETVVVITDIETSRGNMILPIQVAQEGSYLDVEIGEVRFAKINLVASAYGKEIMSLIEYAANNNGIHYINNEKIGQFTARDGRQLPTPLKVSKFIYIIRNKN